jgi:Kef-type K+ transport system membrane component KefB/Trk K+ transport system NAD-binding subunit
MDAILFDLSIIIIIAATIGVIAKFLKQPVVLAYIIGGVLIGPFGFHLINNIDFVKNIGELGIALLLFVVGLELSIDRLKKVGGSASLIGLIEVLSITGLGFLVARFFGFSQMESIYLGLILAFSSTLVVIKALSDNRELDTLHGRIMLGVLLVQDVIVIIALTVLINTDASALSFVKMAGLGAGLILTAFLSAKYILPLFFKKIAESQEILFIFSLAWCFTFAGAASYLGFSIAIGAFIAGVALANFPYNIEIIGRVKPIRDFFVTIFFVAIGIQIIPTLDKNLFLPMLAFISIILLVKPIIIGALTTIYKYTRRTAFLSGFGLAQISEFSIILAMQGVLLNQISDTILSMAIILTAITMLISTYTLKYDNTLYHLTGKFFMFFNRNSPQTFENVGEELKDHIVIFGADRMGRKIVDSIHALNKKVIVIDYNPDVIAGLMSRKINCICGDAEDPEILERLELGKAYAIISTIPNHTTNRTIIRSLKKHNHQALFFSVATNTEEALKLYEDGADYIILPAMLAGEKLSDVIQNFKDPKVIDVLRLRQMVELEKVRSQELMERTYPDLIHLDKKLKFHKNLLKFK